MKNAAKWMWKYGEYELYHSLLLHTRREEYGAEYPPMWRVPSVSPWLELYYDFENAEDGYAVLYTRGKGFIVVDEQRYPSGERVKIAAGKHSAYVRVINQDGFAAAFVESDVCPSGEGWYSRRAPRRLGDAAERIFAGATPVYDSPEDDLSRFPFVYKKALPVKTERKEDGVLYDFGAERFASLCFSCADESPLFVTYGESLEEALDFEQSLLKETVSGKKEYALVPRAFRYVFVRGKEPLSLYALDECLCESPESSFEVSDELWKNILRISADTFRMNSREFFLDGIKRDRWVWSGDAFQSYMIDRYFRRDKELMRRTILALGGDGVYEEHINTITDYSLYWLISVEEYHKHYGDEDLLRYIYPKMQSLLYFCESRLNEDGFFEGADTDWVFVDWTEYDKVGAVCAEQILLRKAYGALAYVAQVIGKDGTAYKEKEEALAEKIKAFYWDEEKGAFIDSYASGKRNVTRHANILAVLFGYADEGMRASILKNVLLNDGVTKITTPYFAFYEMDALARLGELSRVTERVKDYWGGMLALGATSVWEEFVPEKKGTEHYEMYGMRYGKSLCHAWGAGPIYLFGRYYLGVEETEGGVRVCPNLGGLERISGKVLLKNGFVRVSADENEVRAYAEGCDGVLVAFGKEYTIRNGKELLVSK